MASNLGIEVQMNDLLAGRTIYVGSMERITLLIEAISQLGEGLVIKPSGSALGGFNVKIEQGW